MQELEAYKESLTGSTPSFSEFQPHWIPYQNDLIYDIKHNFDYSLGTHVVMLSGSVGSAKSLLMAHLVLRHCLEFPGARVLLGRKSLPDLKETIFKKIQEHMEGTLVEGKHYSINESSAKIKFANGSEIISRSWGDKKYKKFRSLELSMAVVEETTENDEDDQQAIKEIMLRLGRIPHVCKHENLFITATNPDAPSHWAYDYFIKKAKTSARHYVYYSITTDNPFLPPEYIESLKDDLDPKEADRMLRGLWIEISREVIYSTYSEERHFRDEIYIPEAGRDIHITWDFNIALGKPLSLCLFVFDGAFHFFDEVIIEGADTMNACEELAARGLLDFDSHYIVNGDATAKAKSTKSLKSDYDIIEKFLANYRTKDGARISFEMAVPKSNPPVKTRHIRVRAYQRSESGKTRMFVYKKCKFLNKGFKLTALKKGSSYIEDDSKDYQHVTTAAGYGICWIHKQITGIKTGLTRRKIR